MSPGRCRRRHLARIATVPGRGITAGTTRRRRTSVAAGTTIVAIAGTVAITGTVAIAVASAGEKRTPGTDAMKKRAIDVVSQSRKAGARMTKTIARTTLALAFALAAAPALADQTGSGVDLSIHYGVDKYDSVGLRSGLAGTDFSSSQQLGDASQSVGATLIARLGVLDLGVIGELGRPGKDNTTSVIGGLAGFNFDVGPLRLEALGEAGGHRYGNALQNPAVIGDSDRSDWLAYVGLRPGVSVRLGEGGAFLGVWGFARWDVTSKDVQVTLQDGTGTGSYKLGGSQFGAALRLGFSI
jgi:hypothetical protein